MIRAVTEKDRERLERLFPGRFEFEEEPDIEDYIYDGEKMRTLAGRKLSKKRNHINAFKNEHPDYELVPLTPYNADLAWDFVEHWCRRAQPRGRDQRQSALRARGDRRRAGQHGLSRL